jgi:hypothetical protein
VAPRRHGLDVLVGQSLDAHGALLTVGSHTSVEASVRRHEGEDGRRPGPRRQRPGAACVRTGPRAWRMSRRATAFPGRLASGGGAPTA